MFFSLIELRHSFSSAHYLITYVIPYAQFSFVVQMCSPGG